MGGEIRTLGKHTMIYGAGVALGKLASFLMLPIYTRYLTPADYGVLELLTMTINVIGTLAGMGLAVSVFKFYAQFDDPRERNEVIGTAAGSILALALLTAAVGLALAPGLSRLVLGDAGDPWYFRLFFLIYLAQAGEIIPFLLIRALHRSTLFVGINIARLVAMLSLNIYFVAILRMGVLGVLVSQLIVTALLGSGLMIFLYRQVGFSFSSPKFRMMARFGYPVMLVSLGKFALVFSDRYFINHFAGPSAVGIYSLAYRFAFILSAFAFTPFQMVWGPRRYEIAKRPDAKGIYRRVFFYLNLALGSIALIIALFAGDVLRVMADPAFLPARQVVPLLLVAQVIHHWTSFSNLGLFLTDKTANFAWASYIGVAAVIALNFLLIPRYGIHGAAWATILAYTVRFASVYAFAQKEYRLDHGWPPIAKLYMIFAIALAARSFFAELSVPASLSVSSAIALSVAVIVYKRVLGDGERAILRNAIRRRIFLPSVGT